MKKIVLVFLTLLVLLCACGKQEENNWTIQENIEKRWAISDSISIPMDISARGIVSKQDAVFYMSDDTENNLLNVLPYANQSNRTAVTVEYPDTVNFTDCYFIMACDSGMENNDLLTLWRLDFGIDGKEHYELVRYDQSGTILENINISAWGIQEEIKDIQKVVEKNDTYYFLINKKLIIVTEQQEVKRVELQSKKYDILSTQDKIFLVEHTASEMIVYDISEGAVGDYLCKIPISGEALFIDEQGRILVSATGRLYRCDIVNNSMELLLEWSTAGLKSNNIRSIVSVSEDSIIVSGYEENTYTIWILCTTDMVDERTVLTLLTRNDSNWWLTNRVYEFNEMNEEYRVVIENPTTGLAEEDVQTRMQILLTSSNPPDLVDLCFVEHWDEYAQKGIFADLSLYFQNSNILEESDYLPNILAGGKVGEQQIFLPYSFKFTMMYGQEKYLGDEPGWTLQELLDKYYQQEDISVLNYEPALSLQYLLAFSMEEFIDYSKAECNFEVPLFYSLLQCAAEAHYSEGDYSVFCSTILDEKAMIDTAILFNIESYFAYTGMVQRNTLNRGTKLILKGYPSTDGEMRGEASFYPSTYFAISSGSDNKDGAWQFIEHCQSYQHDFYDSFPARRDWLLERMQTVKPDNFIGAELREPTEEDVEELLSIIDGLEFSSNQDEVILQMIVEEAQEYFEGQKSEKEVAQIIQNKIQLYLWENSNL